MDPLPRKRGRPPAKVPSSSVTAWVPIPQHDRLASIARRQGISISATVRRAVFLFLKDDSSGPRT